MLAQRKFGYEVTGPRSGHPVRSHAERGHERGKSRLSLRESCAAFVTRKRVPGKATMLAQRKFGYGVTGPRSGHPVRSHAERGHERSSAFPRGAWAREGLDEALRKWVGLRVSY